MKSLKETFLESEFNELVFEHKNKSYGAYVLRKGYFNTINLSFFIALISFLFILTFSIWSKWFINKPDSIFEINPKDRITEVNAFPAGTKLDIPSPPKPEKMKSIEKAISKPEIKKDLSLPSPNKNSTQADKVNTEPSNKENQNTENNSQANETNKEGANSGLDTNRVFKFSELDHLPQFDGDIQEFISRNLIYPAAASSRQIEGEVLVYFEVDKEGYVDHVSIKKGIGFGCDEESKKLIMKMPRWTPGVFNKRPVKVSFVLPIYFKMR